MVDIPLTLDEAWTAFVESTQLEIDPDAQRVSDKLMFYLGYKFGYQEACKLLVPELPAFNERKARNTKAAIDHLLDLHKAEYDAERQVAERLGLEREFLRWDEDRYEAKKKKKLQQLFSPPKRTRARRDNVAELRPGITKPKRARFRE